MKRAVAVAMVMLAGAAAAAEKKTYSYICKGGNFVITATVDNSKGFDQWSKTEPVVLQIDGEPPQTLVADPDVPDADSYKNKDYEFYALKKFINLTRKSHGTVVKFYSGCQFEK